MRCRIECSLQIMCIERHRGFRLSLPEKTDDKLVELSFAKTEEFLLNRLCETGDNTCGLEMA